MNAGFNKSVLQRADIKRISHRHAMAYHIPNPLERWHIEALPSFQAVPHRFNWNLDRSL
jgi:hypothetical protein